MVIELKNVVLCSHCGFGSLSYLVAKQKNNRSWRNKSSERTDGG